MIDPIIPAAALQSLTARVERALLPIAITSMPKALMGPAQLREIGGTVTQAAPDGSAILHTAAGDIGIKAPMALAPGRTATLLLVPTPAGLTASLQVNGSTAPIAPAAAQPPASTAMRPAEPGIPASAGHQPQTSPVQMASPGSPSIQAPTVDRTAMAAPSIAAPSATASAPSAAVSAIPAATLAPTGTSAPLPHRQPPSPAPTMLANPGLRDAALLISQLAVQLIDQPLPAVPAVATGADIGEPATPPISTLQHASQAVTANTDNRPLPADAASLLIGLSAAVRRPQLRAEQDEPHPDPKEDRASVGDLGYRPGGKASEPVDNTAWRQFQVMDENRVVAVFLGRHPQEQSDEEQTDRASVQEAPARFTVRFDLDHAGPVRIDSVYRDQRLDMLLTLESVPDTELQTSVRDRLAALSDEFGLSISLRIGGPAPAAD